MDVIIIDDGTLHSPIVIDNNEECVVCYLEYDLDEFETLPCKHKFCKYCVDTIRAKQFEPTCPYCRAPFPYENENSK